MIQSIDISAKNPGVVPPWLLSQQIIATNTGTVPPWFGQISLAGAAGGETQFVPQSTIISPMTLVDALRSR